MKAQLLGTFAKITGKLCLECPPFYLFQSTKAYQETTASIQKPILGYKTQPSYRLPSEVLSIVTVTFSHMCSQ